MKITCQTCQSKYTVSDEKVQGKTVKIKCRKCGATILVNSSGATQSAPGAADPVSVSGSAGEGGGTYLVNVAEGDQRSLSLAEVVAAYNSATINADTYVWADGMGDWQPLGQVEAIVSALNSGASAPPPPAAPAYEPPARAAAAAPAPEPRAAARRDQGRRADVFSGGRGGQATEEVATSARAYNGRPPPVAHSTGQREENSMLFSLSALTAKPSTSAQRVTTAREREDSGIIDLKALAASAGAAPAASAMPDHAGLFPLGVPQAVPNMAPPMLGGLSMAPPPAANKTPIFIGVGIAVASLAIVGAFFVMKGGEEKPPPVAEAALQAPAPAPTPTAEPTAAPVPTVVATAEPTSTAVAVKSGGGKGGGKGGGTGAKAGGAPAKAGGAPAGPAPAAPAAPAGPKKGNCGCAAGDLMCAMKCSAK